MRARFGARPAVVAKARRALAARGVEGRVDPTGTFIVASMDPGDIRATFGRAASLLERGGGDTTTGRNAVLPIGCCSARPGDDQATGWGTVDVERLARSAPHAWAAREGA